ncbi:hypothetical protein J5Y09_13560 [Roseomonas sp. PWR1]|uniref:Uncharacterized protein n=1 Tax=Roseomonas nitratireducens TaxID=2820810 RepID=A0ABS4AUA6_9PROT|nr:hypothetical protein [Neoroseomonas nitratireducens]MBP0464944.1 hypothetical protein [Neoroseomonas nitratireducens]
MAWLLLALSVATLVATALLAARSQRLRQRAPDALDRAFEDGLASGGGGEFALLLLPGLLLRKRAQRVLFIALLLLLTTAVGALHIGLLMQAIADPSPRMGLSEVFLWAGTLFMLSLGVLALTFVVVQLREAGRVRRAPGA